MVDSSSRKLKVLIVARLSDHKLISKIAPLAKLDRVEAIDLVRVDPLDYPKVRNHNPPRILRRLGILAEAFRFLTIAKLVLLPPRPDVLIGVNFIPHGLYVSIFSCLLGIKSIQLLIGEDVKFVIRNRLLWFLIKHADKIGVRGQQSKQLLVSRGISSQKLFMPPNVLFPDQFPEISPENKSIDLIFIGYLVERKQVDVLLRALKILKEIIPNISMAIVGDGPLRHELVSLAEALEIENNVTFYGDISHELIPDLLQKSRIFVMASRMEGLPMALIEAQIMGLPSVVPAVGDIPSVAKNGKNSLVLTAVGPEDYAEAINLLLTDRELYARLKLSVLRQRNLYSKNYSMDAAIRVWTETIQNVIM